MQSQTIHDRSSPGFEQDAMEFAVLAHLAYTHPVQLTVEEAVRELATGDLADATPVGVKDAIRQLKGVGLLREHGEYIVPTRSTLRFVELWEHH